jgi:pimeloyl-ACP methyl ester carboxylesterase
MEPLAYFEDHAGHAGCATCSPRAAVRAKYPFRSKSRLIRAVFFAFLAAAALAGLSGAAISQAFPAPAAFFPEPNWNIAFTWNGTEVSEGGQYGFALAEYGESAYGWPAELASGAAVYGDIYRGELNNAELVAAHALAGGGFATSSDRWLAAGRYFVAIYEFDPGECPLVGDICFLPSVEGARSWFKAGFASLFSAPPQNWGIISFEIVEASPEPPPPEPEKFSSVAFLPGIQASRLYRLEPSGGENRLWEPNRKADVQKLFLDENGISRDGGIYTRDVIDETNVLPLTPPPLFGFNIYKKFIGFMDTLVGEGVINAWEALPYDWRLGLGEIVAGGVALGGGADEPDEAGGAGERYSMVGKIEELASASATGQVTVIAHSNGGLLAKVIIDELLARGEAGLVDKLILVAVPQLGTPKAIASLLHGDGQVIPQGLGFILDRETARELGENMPSAYTLLPSPSYFAAVLDPVVEFGAAAGAAPALLGKFRDQYGLAVNTFDELRSFLSGEYGARMEPEADDTDTPNVLNTLLMAEAEAARSTLGEWGAAVDAGIEIFQIAGWGLDTLRGLRYVGRGGELDREPLFVSDGDGTVVTASAAAMEEEAETFYVNLFKYNRFLEFNVNRSHANILEIGPVQDLINRIINEDLLELPRNITINKPNVRNTDKKLHLRVLSPVSLDIYDSEGNHTGLMPNPDPDSDLALVEEQIPNSYYLEFGEGKYVGLDAGNEYGLELKGLGNGTFTLEIGQTQGNDTVGAIAYADIPVLEGSRAELTLSTIDDAGGLLLDLDGDGESDFALGEGAARDPLVYGAMVRAFVKNSPRLRPIIKKLLRLRLRSLDRLIKKGGTRAVDRILKQKIRRLEKLARKKKVVPADARALIQMFERLRELVVQ